MQNDSAISQQLPITVGIECESLEGTSWGVGRLVRRLLEGLAQRNDLKGRFRFVLYSNDPLPDDALYEHSLFSRRPSGLKAIFGSWAPSSFSLYYYILLPLRLFFDRPSVVYLPNYMLPIGTPVKSLVMLTDDIFSEALNPSLALRYRLAYRIYATFWARRHATKVLAISHATASTLRQKGIAGDRIVVNQLGVHQPNDLVQLAKKNDFLFVGQAFERRHVRELLQAFERIANDDPESTFQFIGFDKYPEPTIAPLVSAIHERLGREAILSQERVSDHDLMLAYRSAKTLVYVSDTEAFGMPPLEALSWGTPAVVANTPVMREIYGAHAFFVPLPISPEGIESAMRASLDDDAARERIRVAGPDIVARYSWQAHADRFIGIVTDMTV